MFVLPTLPLSRAERLEAKLAPKRRSPTSPDAGGPDAARDTASSSPAKSQTRLSGGFSATFQQLLSSALRLDHSRSAGSSPKPEAEVQKQVLAGGEFGMNPRPAPTPPGGKRTSAPPEEWWSRGGKGSGGPVVPALPVAEVKEAQLPPLPSTQSPKRQKSKARPTSEIFRALEEDPFNGGGGGGSFSRRKERKVEVERQRELTRSATAPVKASEPLVRVPTRVTEVRTVKNTAVERSSMDVELDSPTSPTSLTSSVKLAGVRGGRIDKAKRLSGGARAARLNLDEVYSASNPAMPGGRGGASDCEEQNRTTSSLEVQMPWRQARGETMSMLLESGFFQAILDAKNIKSASRPLVTADRELPPTPGSIVATPTELYQDKAPLRPLRLAVRPVGHGRKVASKRRSPLSQISTANGRLNSPTFLASPLTVSPARPAAIPENTSTSQTSPLPSGASTPVATQIRLRGGSVVTVCPPELTAWQRSVYIQGAAQLPQPTLLPRKNSVASLELFQEAIEQVYQTALTIPRRRSDEQVADDVCGFFDDFGFEEVRYAGDVLYGPSRGEDGDGGTMDADDEWEFEFERFSTPPLEPEVTPVERVKVMSAMGKALPVDFTAISAEQARGSSGSCPRTSKTPVRSQALRRARRDSGTLTHGDDGPLQLSPVPEEAMYCSEMF